VRCGQGQFCATINFLAATSLTTVDEVAAITAAAAAAKDARGRMKALRHEAKGLRKVQTIRRPPSPAAPPPFPTSPSPPRRLRASARRGAPSPGGQSLRAPGWRGVAGGQSGAKLAQQGVYFSGVAGQSGVKQARQGVGALEVQRLSAARFAAIEVVTNHH
jgi:hypothetical protein